VTVTSPTAPPCAPSLITTGRAIIFKRRRLHRRRSRPRRTPDRGLRRQRPGPGEPGPGRAAGVGRGRWCTTRPTSSSTARSGASPTTSSIRRRRRGCTRDPRWRGERLAAAATPLLFTLRVGCPVRARGGRNFPSTILRRPAIPARPCAPIATGAARRRGLRQVAEGVGGGWAATAHYGPLPLHVAGRDQLGRLRAASSPITWACRPERGVVALPTGEACPWKAPRPPAAPSWTTACCGPAAAWTTMPRLAKTPPGAFIASDESIPA